MTSATATSPTDAASPPCRWCGLYHGARCPIVKALDFYADGVVKRVEFVTDADAPPWPRRSYDR